MVPCAPERVGGLDLAVRESRLESNLAAHAAIVAAQSSPSRPSRYYAPGAAARRAAKHDNRCAYSTGFLSSVTEVLLRLLSATSAIVLSLLLCSLAQAAPGGWHPPAGWLDQALCLHRHEGDWNAATGNGFEGGMQFLLSTWVSVGGTVDSNGRWASVVPVREQLYRAWLVWKRDGHSWREWGTAQACGLV